MKFNKKVLVTIHQHFEYYIEVYLSNVTKEAEDLPEKKGKIC